jgi:hypothetical protein
VDSESHSRYQGRIQDADAGRPGHGNDDLGEAAMTWNWKMVTWIGLGALMWLLIIVSCRAVVTQ